MKSGICGITTAKDLRYHIKWKDKATMRSNIKDAVEKLARWKYEQLLKDLPREYITQGFILGLVYAEYISYEESELMETWIKNQ